VPRDKLVMLEAWRMVKQKHIATAFSSEGATKTEGRWNVNGAQRHYP
jgi:RES domain-containing protein